MTIRDQGEGAERRDGTGRGAGDHRAVERREQRRSVRSQHRSEQGGSHQPAGARDRTVEARSRRGVTCIMHVRPKSK